MNFTKLIKLICAGTTIGACLLATGCEVNTTVNKNTVIEGYGEGYTQQDDGRVISDASQVDFTNYVSFSNNASDYSIKVRNNTQKKLIAFKGSPREENLISGIPASATNFGLKNVTSLFGTTSCDFILFIVTEEDYNAHKSALNDLDNSAFTKFYAYYNSNSSDNNFVYEISRYMGGSCSITVNNANSAYNVELRRNGVNGETIGYAGYGTVNTTFRVEPGEYYIFPVFRKYDNNIGEIVTVFPKKSSGKAVVEVLELSAEEPDQTISSNNWGTVTFSPSCAYIKIYNGGTKGVSLYSGATGNALVTSTGGKMINAGKSRVFTVNMDLIGGEVTKNPEYTTSTTYSQYCIGNAVTDKIYIINNSTTAPTTSFSYEAGKMYTVNVYDDENQEFRVDTSWMNVTPDTINY